MSPSPVPGGTPEPVTLVQIVAALSVSYSDEGVAMWLGGRHVAGLLAGERPTRMVAAGDIALVAEAVRLIGDADPSDFTVTEVTG